MKRNPLYDETIERAMKMAGGRDELVTLLKITPATLDDWLAGTTAPPHAAFIAMLDLIATGRLSIGPSRAGRHGS